MRAVDPAYQWKIRAEAEHWTKFFNPGLHGVFRAAERLDDARYTGSPDRSWLDDLAARGPFGTAAVLGCDAGGYEAAWWGRGSSEELDVYDLTPAVLRRVRAGMTDRGRVRFIQADLNFVQLPAARYDVIWSSGCLHHIANRVAVYVDAKRTKPVSGEHQRVVPSAHRDVERPLTSVLLQTDCKLCDPRLDERRR